MRLCRFNGSRLGVVKEGFVHDVTAALDVLPYIRWPTPLHDPMIAHLIDIRQRIEAIRADADVLPLTSVRLDSPICAPSKVIGAPVNYRDHVAEAAADSKTFFAHQLIRIQDIGLFLKATSSLVGPSEGIRLRHPDRRTDHELELAVVIGETADQVSRLEAMRHVAGYAIGLDITVRGPEERSMRKSIDTYSVIGPWLVTADEIPDPGKLDMTLTINGERRQSANTSDLIVDVPGLIEMASAFYTLHPGDVIMTGTPAGVGPLDPGDLIVARIDGIGQMEVAVTASQAHILHPV